jgi:trehalose 6-phosphate synthase
MLLVASNRGPVAHARDADGALVARRGSGGLVAGLSALGRGATWICAALNDEDRATVRSRPGLHSVDDGPSAGAARVRMLDIEPSVQEPAYSAVANRTLWFLHHMLFDVPHAPSFGAQFDRDWWAYRRYNEIFAEAVAEEAAPGATVLVQDYHLALAPQLVRAARPDLRIGHFSHTPWAPVDYLRLLPDRVVAEYLRGLLGADRLAFLSERWAAAFLAGCAAVLPEAQVRPGELAMEVDGRRVRLGVHPLGVDVDDLRDRATRPAVEAHHRALLEMVGRRRVLLRVDRAEPSKNILRGLDAYAELLHRRPDLHGEVVHLAFVCPSRSDVPEYRSYLEQVRRRAEEIVAEYGRPDWQPLHLEVRDDVARSLAAYRLADVVIANPVRDGMNLVAKEAPVLSERSAVLVLSREAGAADELGRDALLVNPFDIGATATAFEQALGMDAAERRGRSERLVSAAGACPPSRWLRDQVEALSS